MKIATIFGTRPEAIKVAPFILEVAKRPEHKNIVISTGQHQEMLDQVLSIFGIDRDYDLEVFEPGQPLEKLTSKLIERISASLRESKPDLVVVQGDTASAAFGALSAFYQNIPVVHLEAGLRTGNIYSPFPEEFNRKLITQIAALNLVPTDLSANNLLTEGVSAETVLITGNTVIDALENVIANHGRGPQEVLESFGIPDSTRQSVLVTIHRRENLGEPLVGIANALRRLTIEFPETEFILPLHLNPLVRETIHAALSDRPNAHLLEPLSYLHFTEALSAVDLILTDSGGVQEEAPALGKPVLVLRETTERPEGLSAGTVKLVGTDESKIYDEARKLLTDPEVYASMSHAKNPYGDGRAAERSLDAIEWHFLGAQRPTEFSSHR